MISTNRAGQPWVKPGNDMYWLKVIVKRSSADKLAVTAWARTNSQRRGSSNTACAAALRFW